MNVVTEGGLRWILFKRFHEFADLDKEVIISPIVNLVNNINNRVIFSYANILMGYQRFQ